MNIDKKLLLLGGSRNMQEVLEAAQSMGLTVGITDWYDITRSPIKLFADEYYNISINDDKAIDDLILHQKYDGVLTGYTDSYLVTYAEICKRNNLHSYGETKHFKILTDKFEYKKLFDKNGVPTIEAIDLNHIDEGLDKFPIILKPIDGSGGKGLEIANNYNEFLEICNKIGSNKLKEKYIIEPYIVNRNEMTAFFLFIDGECYLSGTANRFLSTKLGTRIGLPMFYSMPSSYDNIFRKHTAPPMIKAFKEIGLQNGMLFAQCIIYDGKPCVYDVGYRLTGTLEYKLQEKMYGFNPLKMMINHSVNGRMTYENMNYDEKNILESKQFGYNVTILGKVGTIKSITGEEVVRSIPDVIDVAFKMVEGDIIDQSMVGTLGQIICRIFFVSDSIEQSINVLKKIYESIEVTDQFGNDMIVDRMDEMQLIKAYKEEHYG